MSSGQKAPTGYQPTGQGQADAGYQTAANTLASAGQGLSSYAVPQYWQVAQNVVNNPYYTQAQTGANQAASTAQNFVVPGQLWGALNTGALGDQAAAAAAGALNKNNSTYNDMLGAGLQTFQQGQTLGSQFLGMGQDATAMGSKAYQDALALLPQALSGYGQGSDISSIAQRYAGIQDSYLPQATAGYGYAKDLLDKTLGLIPQYMQGGAQAQSIMNDARAKGQQAWDQSQNLINSLVGTDSAYAKQVLGLGMDPQHDLYNRTLQQVREQSAAQAAQSGLAGSPFAAGLANDAMRNFNIDWQNTALDRATKALGAYDSSMGANASAFNTLMGAGAGTYGSLLGTGVDAYTKLNQGDVSNYASLLGAGTGAFNSLTNGATGNLTALTGSSEKILADAAQADFSNRQASMNDAISRYTALLGGAAGAYGTMAGAGQGFDALGLNAMNQGTAGYNSLTGTALAGQNANVNNFLNLSQGAQGAYGNASTLGTDALNTMTTASQLPNDIYIQNQNQILQALQAMTQGTNASYGLTEDAMNAYGNYMKIGQSATSLAQNAAQINNAQSNATWQGIGKLAGLAVNPFVSAVGGKLAGLVK